MTDRDQDEFVALRRRAYGRSGDIHLDPVALARLAELENTHRPVVAEEPFPDVVSESSPVSLDVSVESTEEETLPTPWWISAGRRVEPMARAVGRWARGLRRSTVLIGLGTGLIVASLITTLIVVQRVQTDPLQIGAQQVARLGVDTSYENPFPDSFGADPGEGDIVGYREFYGLRAVRGLGAVFGPHGAGAESECILLYVVSTLEVSNGGFGGTVFSACGAGEFPAILQLALDAPELPAELAAAHPDADGMQFVYDSENDEVVVFVDR